MASEVLVTGGAGFIGSHVVDRLIEGGQRVTVVDDLSTGNFRNLNPEAKFIKCDITKAVPEADYEYIYHLAAKARVQPSIEDPLAYNETNVTGTLNVLELAREIEAKVIYASSSSVYGDAETPTPETHPTNPKSPYALQKLIGEHYLKLYQQLFDQDFVALRFFNVYGERQLLDGSYSSVIGRFLKAKQTNRPMQITNDGGQRRDFTYVGDVSRGVVKATDWPSGVYNIGNGANVSVNEVADMVGGERQYIGDAIEPRETLADNFKAKELGWQPTTQLKDWIHDTLSR